MAYLNNVWFENELVNPPGDGEINFKNGYKAERIAGQHIPPDGWYWLAIEHRTLIQTLEYGKEVNWILVNCTGLRNGISQLREIHFLGGNKMQLDWYDFKNAHWRGPVDMPKAPDDKPETGAQRQ